MNIMEGLPINILYFLIGFIASVFGSIAGIGGGVIIKPALDLFGHYDVETIGILSAVTVFAMATVSLTRTARSGMKIKYKTSSILALASIVGGVIGKVIFNHSTQTIDNLNNISLVQSLLLSGLMLLILIYTKKKHAMKMYELSNGMLIFLFGLILGMFAAFLGIGGGPFNVAVLTIGFSMSFKEASVNSIFIIFFSQLSSLVTTQMMTGFGQFNLELLPFIALGGVVGGLIGSSLLKKINSRHVERIFSLGIFIILLINVFNTCRNLYLSGIL